MSITPKKLCIYFSYPSLINGSNGNITSAVNVFKAYNQVVFGKTLELNSHPDHNKTISIIAQLKPLNVSVYGEIDCTLSFSSIKQSVNQWQGMAVKGIYCNKMGYDYSVNRSMQNQILNYIHSKNLEGFVVVWNPDDIFSSTVNPTYNPTGTASVINSNDWYLATSYQIINGAFQTVSDWTTRANKLVNYKQSFGTKMACITTADASPFNQSMMDYAYFSTILYGFDSFGWGELNFSATTNSLPFRTRKIFYGTKFDSAIMINGSVYERKTNIGIRLNTSTHTLDVLLDM